MDLAGEKARNRENSRMKSLCMPPQEARNLKKNKLSQKTVDAARKKGLGWWLGLRIRNVIYYAIISRVLIFIVAVFSNWFVADYDSCFDILFADEKENGLLHNTVKNVIKVFTRWDALYFNHIAQHGYVYEQENAFFPMFPLLTSFLSITVFYPLEETLGTQLTYMLSGICVSNISFIGSAIAFYRLGIVLFGNESFAYLSTILYCFTPAGIFMSSIYTESTFALFTFVCMRLIIERKYYTAAFYLGLGSFTRSNCICYLGFFVYDFFFQDLQWMESKKVLVGRVVKLIILGMISVSGFVIFQVHGYYQFCVRMVPREGESPWCNKRVPIVYNYVQEHYWNVGFLKYYELKQLPNFMFALPMIILCFKGIMAYAKHDTSRFLTLGIFKTKDELQTDKVAKNQSIVNHEIPAAKCYTSVVVLPYIYLWCFLLFVSTTTMHIQVITRFMSSMPTVYWYMSHVIFNTRRKDIRQFCWSFANVIVLYIVTYAMIGAVLFSNFFPPA